MEFFRKMEYLFSPLLPLVYKINYCLQNNLALSYGLYLVLTTSTKNGNHCSFVCNDLLVHPFRSVLIHGKQ